ncbi:MAG TPA: response regulator [Candidatus Tectomicrobia bacterium]|nr:response regulator [Candidatus Tectomicrobia bacterium]
MGQAPKPLTGIHVFVVDEHDDLREVITSILAYFGALVTSARSIGDALPALRHMTPDVVVCDLDLGGEGAYAFIRTLRDQPPPLGRVPVLATTGSRHEHPVSRVQAAGFDARLAKPFAPDMLCALVAALARRTDLPGSPPEPPS